VRVTTDDGVALAVTDHDGPAAPVGAPMLFVHEFGGDHRSWDPQVRHFARTRRCVTYDARGYPPSDVPTDPAAYSQDRAVADAVAVLPRTGHLANLELPDVVDGLIEEFVAGVAARVPAADRR
jgi:pimeloyl-ACP methyl ester carboxylesterase